MTQQRLYSLCIPELLAMLGGLLLITACATPFGIAQQKFRLLPPNTLKQPTTVLLSINSHHGNNSHHWEAVLNVDANQIDLVILGPLGQRLATLGFDGQHLTVYRSNPISIDISLEKLLGELQMIFWPLAVLNTDKWNRGWHFEEQKHIRHVYYQQQRVAEIHRYSSSPCNGNFDYISKISDFRMNIRSSQLDHS